jgi:MFS family permease
MLQQIRRRVLEPLAERDERNGTTGGYPHFRRNYTLGIANGLLFNVGLSFFNRTTIIPVFLSTLGAPSVLISLTALFESLGWHLPQLFASKFVVHKPLKMALYGWASVIRVIGLLLAIASALVAVSAPFWALVLFVGGYGLFAVASGFAGLVFTEILAKTCPKEKRGSYFGWRQILSGIVGLYMGVNVINPIFDGVPFPRGFLTAFSVGTVLIAISFYLFVRQKEPTQTDLPPKRTMRTQLTTAGGIIRGNHAFRRFVTFRALMMLWFAGIPFYMLLARDRLGASEAEMGTFISWEFAGLIVANVFWSYISNRVGNRRLLIIACSLGAVVSAGVILYALRLVALPAWSFGLIFFLSAAVDSGVGNGGINYALEIVPEAERPTYVGLMNTLLAAALGLAGIAGVLRDIVDYQGLYLLTFLVAIASLVMILRLPEPRREVKLVGLPS